MKITLIISKSQVFNYLNFHNVFSGLGTLYKFNGSQKFHTMDPINCLFIKKYRTSIKNH